MKPQLPRMPVIAGAIAIGLVAALSAQGSQPIPGVADLLTEVRGLRADLNQAAGASLRAQLLVARLTLQEQRITTLGKQLTDVQAQLQAAINDRSAVESKIKMMDGGIADGSIPPEQRRDLEAMVRELKTSLSQAQSSEQQLRLQESELVGIIAGEQSRWSDFNARLDEIERSLPSAKPR